MIATLVLVAALVLVGTADWPSNTATRVCVVMLAIGIVYTIYSEWLNTVVHQSWAYSSAVPRLPGLGRGFFTAAAMGDRAAVGATIFGDTELWRVARDAP